MLLVTENAKGALKTALENLEVLPGQYARIRTTLAGHFALSLDTEAQGDQVVTHGGAKVLLVDKETAERLAGVVLDYRDSKEGPEFTLLRTEESEQAG